MEQPEYREVRSWDHQDVSIRQKAVGLTMDQEGKVWFWCQTMMETPDRVSLFAFVEKIPNPTLNSWSGAFDPLGDRLFERGAERVRQITAGALQLQPWSGGWITNEFVTPLSMIWEPLDGAEPPEVVEPDDPNPPDAPPDEPADSKRRLGFQLPHWDDESGR